ncbi:heat shock 70 kDa protein 14-like [Haliotis cracherodii]|uniref:heat shock 70 kDa protein 14-like n=1 Tax=Haliotis cracherodii TaxID=6455 RepID=UPI0039EC6D7F
MAAFGVHFGTCSACLAVYKDGKADVVANDLGDRVTPCVVAFTDHDQSVGAAAKQGIIRNAANTISNVKQILGRKMEDPVVENFSAKSTAKVVEKNGIPQFEVNHKGKTSQYSASQVTEIIYRKMLETAQSHGGSGIQDAVLTVPFGFGPEHRNTFSEAATKAGFNILRLINEASAAALAYDLGQMDHSESSYALVYRLGGTSSDATVLKIENGMYRVCSSTADTQFGGNQFTEVLLKYLATEFKRQYKADVTENKRSVTKLRFAAETCKHALSTLGNAKCAVDSLYDGMDFHHGVSRARFESLCTSLLQQGSGLIEKCLAEAGLNKTDISKVILCGGGAKVPIVQKSVADTVKGAEILTSISPDEVIAMGAAKEAAFLVGKEIEDLKDHEEHTQARCLSSCVCVKVSDDPETDNLITALPKLSLIPSRKQHTFTLADAQDNFSMEVYEASDPPTLQNSSLLARIVMRDLPTPSSIQANFHLRREGTLHVTCQELTSNREESVTIGIS